MMKLNLWTWLILSSGLASGMAQAPENLLLEGVPAIPAALRHEVAPYLEFRAAGFSGWHPTRREMLIATRFADAAQLHLVRMPLGARRQITFLPEPVAGGSFQPATGEFAVFLQDKGGGEFYQLYRLDMDNGKITLLTDGKSRNSAPRWSHAGRQFAYTSTRRNGRDTDVYVMDPAQPTKDRMVIELSGGGWAVADWAPDDSKLLLLEGISINESYLWLADLKAGTKQLLTPKSADKVSRGPAQFARDGKSIFLATDEASEFKRLASLSLPGKQVTVLTPNLKSDIEAFDLSEDGRLLAFVSNEEGASALRLWNVKSAKEIETPKLPTGVIGSVRWHKNSRDLAFNLNSARSPNDVYVLDARTGKLERWTESETGGLNPSQFVEPELVKVRSFDGLTFSALVYRPDPKRFPGPRPVLVNIHGGPEGQSRPVFQARNNYYLNELGVAVVYPNVRGSDGFGKTFLTLDNGFKREDSVKDIGALIDWLRRSSAFDPARIGVIGGSYGGYMVLASMVHFSENLRCGIDVVGISNFLTFLKNTQDYRRDLRRVEYGDERDPAMAAFLARIAPSAQADKIRKPLFVAQGFNDPRVPVTESEQMVQAIREHGGKVWYLMAKDEGHGFQKKKNADYFFLSSILFVKQFLVGD